MFSVELKVRYAETDQMGIVYYANYFVWMEVARTEWFSHRCGRSYAELEKQGIFLPVLEAQCNYKHPVYYPEIVTIFLIPQLVKKLYIAFEYEIKVKDSLRAIGFTKHILINRDGKIIRPLPDFIVNAISDE